MMLANRALFQDHVVHLVAATDLTNGNSQVRPIKKPTQISWMLKPIFIERMGQLHQRQFWLETISMWQMLVIHGL